MNSITLLFILLSLLTLTYCQSSVPSSSEDKPKPYSVPDPKNSLFFETFQSDAWTQRWIRSKNSKFAQGDWAVGQSLQNSSIKEERGLLVKSAAKHHAISAVFSKPLDIADAGFVLQYEVRFHRHHECGGAYLKLFEYSPKFKQQEFSNDTPYVIMFGPDRCGSSDKVHFIFRHKTPLKTEEKHLKTPPTIRNDRMTHLYTLVIRKDNSFEVLIDGTTLRSGSLLTEFDPPVIPPKEIDDPTAQMPKDWVTQAKIADPTAVKPDDWDESEPEMMIDINAKKPDQWDENAPSQIPDPQVIKPNDWNDEEDGEWEAPLIDNPACGKHGCGPWTAPKIKNPKYKGKWKAPMIDNPKYIGEWAPPKIPNPDYYEDLEPHKMTKIGGIGIEIWTMQDEIEFDNIYVGTDPQDAREWADMTWAKKHAIEQVEHDRNKAVQGKGLAQKFNHMLNEYPVLAVVMIIVVSLLALFFFAYCCARPRNDSETVSHGHSHGEEDEEEEEEEEEDDELDTKVETKPVTAAASASNTTTTTTAIDNKEEKNTTQVVEQDSKQENAAVAQSVDDKDDGIKDGVRQRNKSKKSRKD